MRLVEGLLDYRAPVEESQVRIFTGNPVVTRSGRVVMGRGAARQVRDHYRDIDLQLGVLVPNNNLVFVQHSGQYIGWFKVKDHWQEPAKLSLIQESTLALAQVAHDLPERTFHLNAPGIGNGRLGWDDVHPILSTLPDNVVVYK